MGDMNELLQHVRQAIAAKSVTVTFLAASCGISRQHLHAILGGQSHPTMPVAEKLADALGLQFTVRKARPRKKLADSV